MGNILSILFFLPLIAILALIPYFIIKLAVKHAIKESSHIIYNAINKSLNEYEWRKNNK